LIYAINKKCFVYLFQAKVFLCLSLYGFTGFLKDKLDINIPVSITPRLIIGITPIFSPDPIPHIIATNGSKYVVKEPNNALEDFNNLLKSTMANAEPTTPKTAI